MATALRWASFFAILAGWLAGAGTALAAPGVHDQAGFFSQEAIHKADAVIQEIKKRHQKDLLIETFKSPPEGKEELATSKDREVKDRFFGQWARKNAEDANVNGIYILICR